MTISRRRALWLVLGAGILAVLGLPAAQAVAHAATCTGSNPCNACKNCSSCAHCAKRGGTCGVCKAKRKYSS